MSLLEMTWLALELLLAARAQFLNQKGAFGAGHVVGMTVVLDRGVAAGWTAKAVKPTLGRRSAAGLGRLKDRPAAVAADLVEDGLRTAPAGASVADLLAIVAAAFQRSSAGSDADMLGLDGRDLPRHPVFPLGGLSLRGLLLAGTAVLSTFVPTAAKIDLAESPTQRVLDVSLMAYGPVRGSPTPAWQVDALHTEAAAPGVAYGLARMPTSENLVTGTFAVGNFVLAGSS